MRDNLIHRELKPSYECVWVDVAKYIDSSDFQDNEKVNIKPNLNGATFIEPSDMQLGPFSVKNDESFNLGSNLLKYEQMFVSTSFKGPQDSDGMWSFDSDK